MLRKIVKIKKYYNDHEDDSDDLASAVDIDTPLLLRLLEFARESTTTDVDLHKVIENLLKLKSEYDTLTMECYDQVVANVKK